MISASHNPVEYNGIKFFDGRGYKLSDELEDKIQAVIESNFEGVPSPVGEGVGRSYSEESALYEYIEYAKSTIKTDFKGLKVALDCANGAAYKAAVKAFRSLGARVYVINDNPDGNNINENCGSTHMEELMDYVVRKKCDIGFAFDGDVEIVEAINSVEAKLNGVGRVLIRPSGTEPLVRVMLEGENQEEINEMANSLVDLILSKI